MDWIRIFEHVTSSFIIVIITLIISFTIFRLEQKRNDKRNKDIIKAQFEILKETIDSNNKEQTRYLHKLEQLNFNELKSITLLSALDFLNDDFKKLIHNNASNEVMFKETLAKLNCTLMSVNIQYAKVIKYISKEFRTEYNKISKEYSSNFREINEAIKSKTLNAVEHNKMLKHMTNHVRNVLTDVLKMIQAEQIKSTHE